MAGERVEYVRLTNDQQDDLIGCVRHVRAQLAAGVGALPTPGARAAVRAQVAALGALADALEQPRVTVVMPGARRKQEVEGG